MKYYVHNTEYKKKFAFFPKTVTWLAGFPCQKIWLQSYWIRYEKTSDNSIVERVVTIDPITPTQEDRRATMTPQEQALNDNPMNYFTQNVDAWTEKEWLGRLIKAVKDHDKARVSGDDLLADTCINIIISTAFRLARDYEETIRQALQSQADKDRVMELMAEALVYLRDENKFKETAEATINHALSEYNKLGGTQDEC